MTGQIAHKGDKAPSQASQRWHVERTELGGFNRLQRCYERRANVIDAFFDLADAIITICSLIRQAWTAYRMGRPGSEGDHPRWHLAHHHQRGQAIASQIRNLSWSDLNPTLPVYGRTLFCAAPVPASAPGPGRRLRQRF